MYLIKRLFASVSACGVMYGILQVHKPDFARKY